MLGTRTGRLPLFNDCRCMWANGKLLWVKCEVNIPSVPGLSPL